MTTHPWVEFVGYSGHQLAAPGSLAAVKSSFLSSHPSFSMPGLAATPGPHPCSTCALVSQQPHCIMAALLHCSFCILGSPATLVLLLTQQCLLRYRWGLSWEKAARQCLRSGRMLAAASGSCSLATCLHVPCTPTLTHSLYRYAPHQLTCSAGLMSHLS